VAFLQMILMKRRHCPYQLVEMPFVG
jgi:hypothetical protein